MNRYAVDPTHSRSVFWNVSFVGTLLLALLLTQVYAGGPWMDVVAIFGGAVIVGMSSWPLVRWYCRLRDPWQRHLREQAKAAHPAAQSRPIHLAAATGESA